MTRIVPATLLAAILAFGAPAGATQAVDTTRLFALGGTPVSNGIFFPGGVTCAGTDCYGAEAALEVPRGNDILFTNLDHAAVANSHQIQCYKRRKRTGRPVCRSKLVAGPGESVMITNHLKPGLYEYTCTTHFNMRGAFRIVAQ